MKKSIALLAMSVLSAAALAHGTARQHAAESMPMPMGGHDMQQMHEQMHGPGMGHPGDPSQVTRTLEIVLDDSLRFVPAELTVKVGETVRFFLKNSGQQAHSMMIGPLAQLKTHAAMMANMPSMPHAAPNLLELKPGKRGGLVWQFDQPGTVDFACLTAGHLDAGMVGKIVVTE